MRDKIEERYTGFWDFMKGVLFGKKAARTAGVVVGETTGSSGPVYSSHDYEKFAKETYLKNVVCYRCIDLVSKSVASVPWGVYKWLEQGKESEEVPDHSYYDILRRPNPEESYAYVMLRTIAFLLMSGNSYLYRISALSGPNKGQVKEMYSLRPDRMTPIKGSDGMLDGWEYKVGGSKKTWYVDRVTGQSDVWQFKTFHPTDDWFGASVTEPASREIDTSNESLDWNMKLLQREGRPGLLVTIVGEVGEEEYQRLERVLAEDYGGTKGVGRNLILTGERGTSAQPYGYSPLDLDWLEGGRELARRIAWAYGVPPQLIGIPGDNTYSNYKEARLDFWETTVFWYLRFLKDEKNNWLFKEDPRECFLNYDLRDIPALAIKEEAKWAKADSSRELTVNEKRALKGYGPKSYGDVILISAAEIPLSSEEILTEEEQAQEEEKVIEALSKKGYSSEEIEKLLAIFEDSKIGGNGHKVKVLGGDDEDL